MEKWIKIRESNFQLFQTNEDLVLFITLLRLSDADGLVDTTMTKVCSTARMSAEETKSSMTRLFNQGLISGNSSEGILLIRINVDRKKWVGGDVARQEKKENLSDIEQQFRERLKLKFDRIAAMPRPLLLSEYNEVSKLYRQDQIMEVMLAMQNYAELTKYTSAKLTLLNWLKRRYG